MENALLYTFSTIPQTLGAALGVLAAFVLYRLQADSGALERDAHTLVGEFGGQTETSDTPPTTLGDLEATGQFAKLISVLDTMYGDKANAAPRQPGSERGLAYRRLKASLATRQQIKSALAKALRVTAAVLIGSAIVLPFSHPLACGPWILAATVLAIGVAGLTWCVRLCGGVIRAALGTD